MSGQQSAVNDEAAFEVRMGLYRKILLAADIGIVGERSEVYAAWVKCLFDEMFETDDTMVPTPFYAGQVGFANGYAKPLFGELEKSKIIPHFSQYVRRLGANVDLLQDHVNSKHPGHLADRFTPSEP